MSNFDLRRGSCGRYQYQALIGMKVDRMNDNVDSLTCDVDWMGFGLVVT